MKGRWRGAASTVGPTKGAGSRMPTLRLDSFIRDHDRVPVLARCRKSRLGGAAPTPNPNRLNCPRRKWTTVSPSAAPPGRLRLNHSQALAQNPAKSRELPRRFALGSTSLCNSRLNGGEGGIRTHGTLASTPDFESGTFNRTPPPLRPLAGYRSRARASQPRDNAARSGRGYSAARSGSTEVRETVWRATT